MVFEIESGFGILVLFELMPAFIQEFAVAQRLYMPSLFVRFVLRSGAVAAKSKDVRFVGDDDVYQIGYLVYVRCADGGHDGAMHTRFADGFYRCESGIERTGFAETVVRLSESVERELVLTATECVHTTAHFGCEMEWIAHERERNSATMDHF